MENTGHSKEYALATWVGLAAAFPGAVGSVIEWWKNAIEGALNTASHYAPSIWSAAPLATPVVAWLGTWRLSQWIMDSIGIKNKFIRYPGIWASAFAWATSAAAPYLAWATWVYYWVKYWWKYWTKALKWLWGMIWKWFGHLNPFSWTWWSSAATA